MIAFLQRVTQAQVSVDSYIVGKIGRGLMVLLCAERQDELADSDQLLQKLLNYRVFADDAGKMNLSLAQMAARSVESSIDAVGLLIVPQFTLAADTRSGTRPSFTPAASPELGLRLFDHFHLSAKAKQIHGLVVETGVFGAHMQVGLVNDGPVSIWLETRKIAIS
jgi:D-aminoacyl-tRNA deacylase